MDQVEKLEGPPPVVEPELALPKRSGAVKAAPAAK
jgi:hypothetical protein